MAMGAAGRWLLARAVVDDRVRGSRIRFLCTCFDVVWIGAAENQNEPIEGYRSNGHDDIGNVSVTVCHASVQYFDAETVQQRGNEYQRDAECACLERIGQDGPEGPFTRGPAGDNGADHAAEEGRDPRNDCTGVRHGWVI